MVAYLDATAPGWLETMLLDGLTMDDGRMPNLHMSSLIARFRSPSRQVWRIDGEGNTLDWAEVDAIHQVNEEFACCELFGEAGTPWAQGGVCMKAVELWLQLTRLHGARDFLPPLQRADMHAGTEPRPSSRCSASWQCTFVRHGLDCAAITLN